MKLLYQQIASLINAYKTTDNNEWFVRFEDRLEWIAKNVLPSGSGIDNGTKIDLDKSTSEKIVLEFGFHHMDEGGYYDGWTEHTAVIRPSLALGIDLKITGCDRNQIKDYLHETYHYVLTSEFDQELLKDI